MMNLAYPMVQYPITDLRALPVQSMERYAALVLRVAGADGLHDGEAAAFQFAIDHSLGQGLSLEKINEIALQPVGEIIQNQDVLRVLAPYVLRDAARVAQADGELSDLELKGLRDSAEALGVSIARLDSIIAAVQFDRKMRICWTHALQSEGSKI